MGQSFDAILRTRRRIVDPREVEAVATADTDVLVTEDLDPDILGSGIQASAPEWYS